MPRARDLGILMGIWRSFVSRIFGNYEVLEGLPPRASSGAVAEPASSIGAPESSMSAVVGTGDEVRQPPVDDDSPITTAEEDRFGVDPFAAIVARSLAAQGSAEGTVVALNGPWGSGKSSAVNLIVHHLDRIGDGAIEVVPFNPWWFSGSDQLANAFLEQVGARIGRGLRDEGRDALRGITSRLTKLDTYLEAGRRLGDDGVGSGVAALLFESRSVEEDHRRLAAALRAAGRQFVVVIDDIDRLNPDEALQMFQLVKSVGRLPYVSYLLAFDRLLIERLLQERYPAEGGRYLEKVLQATFDLPEPSKAVLRQSTLEAAGRFVDVAERDTVRFMNLFEDVVVPRLTSPRQAVRYLGSLRVTFPAVADDVDPGDFMAIEAFRVFEPALYRAIRGNGALVRGEDNGGHEPREAWVQRVEAVLLDSVDARWREWAKTSLQRLFPQLEGAWGNMHYGRDWHRQWELARLICTASNFPTYFSYSVPQDTLTAQERRSLVEASADPNAIGALLVAGLAKPGSDGGTRAALMLEALASMGDLIPIANVGPLLKGLSAIADDLIVEADARRGFALSDNGLRLHWLLNAQVRERLPVSERGPVLGSALAIAQIGWRVSLADRLAKDHDPPEQGERREHESFLDETTARRLKADADADLITAADDGRLLASNAAGPLLWRLTGLKGGDDLVRRLTGTMLDTVDGTVRLAALMTSTTWSQGMGFAGLGDRVASGTPRVQRDGLERIVDPARLHARVAEVADTDGLGEEDVRLLARFLKGWELAQARND